MKIRPDVLRTYQSIHTWTGITTGLLLFIAFFAGALTMFKPQIEQWATPPQQHLSPINHADLDQLIQTSFEQFDKAAEGFTIHFDHKSSPMTWYEKGGGRGFRLDDSLRHATLNDDGGLTTQLSGSNELGELIDHLHRTAGIPGTVGHEDLGVLILGLAALVYFIALISGVIILLPTLVKSLFALRQHKGANRFWLDSHNLVGVISLPFHIIIAWTVVVFAFHDPFYGGLRLVYGEQTMFEPMPKSETAYSFEQLPSINTHIERVNQLASDYQIKSMEYAKLNSVSPSLAAEVVANDRVMRGGYSDFVFINPYTLDVLFTTVNQAENGIYGEIVNSFFGLHFGNYGGGLTRWVYFSLGLLGAFLFYSGNLLWLEKRRQKQQQQSRSIGVMSSLTIGVCLGSLLGVSCAMLATKWLYLLTEQINHSYLACYYVAFFAAIVYSFARGAAIAAIHLLQLLALSCLLIPLSSLIAILAPSLNTWTPADFNSGLIEFMALVFAIAFYSAARKAKRRAYQGEPNSIWFIAPKTTTKLVANEA
ncbi:PepSY-associated TM helix domain-containing protein [Shewanella fidelis]|uniref:PepSY-associated TM helix domain-containing protein n=1 Tax=Shewanella fidelis TaxID=173509 RepID=A0AAW8NIG0_9GAMM|nr:PepSY-associated TM helix domain-containing protein [Shewanella fidelis]MDR8522520.1 PepSY-associated TM helix domain-containing protein [Shewanella fidelis]MDW4812946.1 PepSY-associated TM helix domain-containing protein [Shewanella fidelis]MDW4816795.1 PepSY-associated TM helix domain-containing protein [Shewanella fidelis]MDW4820953.1 PepSY-associated TM helix domain-containing protein [Shewanella fidelis]MDW4825512.1 PepSY-associated TM helix domain-containing protein [Shewanella fideli